jgi:Mn2+/Fe2+ NRAMP family transporter
MVSVQMMCSRLGMVTGRGLASVIRMHYPRWVLWGVCLLLVARRSEFVSMEGFSCGRRSISI